jgi:hypothetical protein
MEMLRIVDDCIGKKESGGEVVAVVVCHLAGGWALSALFCGL